MTEAKNAGYASGLRGGKVIEQRYAQVLPRHAWIRDPLLVVESARHTPEHNLVGRRARWPRAMEKNNAAAHVRAGRGRQLGDQPHPTPTELVVEKFVLQVGPLPPILARYLCFYSNPSLHSSAQSQC